MNLNHLGIFRAVAEEGSVSKGAERLFISQPAVSKQLAEFERALGVALFDRVPKGVRLTEAGALLLSYAQRLFAVEAEAERALRELRGLEKGRLAIGASTSIGTYLLPSVLAAFHQKHPAVEMYLEIGNTEAIQKALETGTLDIGFTEGFVHSSGLNADVFFEDELVCISAPDYGPFAGISGDLPLEKLAHEPLIIREPGSGTREVVEAALAERGYTIQPMMTLGNTEAIKRAVAEGIGIAIVSRLTIQNEERDKRLIAWNIDHLALRRPLHRLEVRGHHASASVRAFLEILQSALPRRKKEHHS